MSQWRPDLGVFRNASLLRATNVYPVGEDGLASAPLLASSYALTATCLGIGTHPDTTNLFYGSTANLREVVFGTSDTNRSGAVYTAEAFPWGWRFQAWGGDIIAVGGSTQRPQYRDADVAGNFADLLDATTIARTDLKPRYISTIGQRVIIGHITDALAGPATYPNRVWWSATDNARRYGTPTTDPTLRTDYQELPDDYGEITGLQGGSDYCYIFKRRAIYRMTLGGAFGFAFAPIAIGTGTVASRSIVPVDGDVYFWGPGGPCVLRQGGVLVNLANTSFSRILTDNNPNSPAVDLLYNQSPSMTHGWYCPFSRCVCWTYFYEDSGGGDHFATLALHLETGRWGLVDFDDAGSSEPRGVVSLYPTATNPYGFGRLQTFVDANNNARRFSFPNMSAVRLTTGVTLVSELLAPKYTSARIIRVRPRFRSTASAQEFDIAVNTYDNPLTVDFPTNTYTSDETAVDEGGFALLETSYSQAFQFDVQFPEAASEVIPEIDGLDVQIEVGGDH